MARVEPGPYMERFAGDFPPLGIDRPKFIFYGAKFDVGRYIQAWYRCGECSGVARLDDPAVQGAEWVEWHRPGCANAPAPAPSG